MNPWDVKLVSNLTEAEMINYVRFLEAEDVVENVKMIDNFVNSMFSRWQQQRAQPSGSNYLRISFSTGGYGGWIGERAMAPCEALRIHDIAVLAPSWLPEDLALYIIREQLLEQLPEDF